MTTDATNKTLDTFGKDLGFIARTAANLRTDDHEDVDAIVRTINDMKAELEAYRLSLAPATEDLSLPAAA